MNSNSVSYLLSVLLLSLILCGCCGAPAGDLPPAAVAADVPARPITHSMSRAGKLQLPPYQPVSAPLGPEQLVGRKVVALVFDDFPFEKGSAQILNVLKRMKVRATFFAVGEKVQLQKNLTRRAISEGHLVQNHTYNHPHLPALSFTQAYDEISHGAAAIHKVTGIRPRYLRAPGGGVSSATRRAAAKANETLIEDLINIGDYRFSAQVIRARVRSRARPESMICLHDALPQTIRALPGVINDLRHDGYTFVTLDEIFMAREADLAIAGSRHS